MPRKAKTKGSERRCEAHCLNSSPFSKCSCSYCDGKSHGAQQITMDDLVDLIDRKLTHTVEMSEPEFKSWLAVLECVFDESEKAERAAKRQPNPRTLRLVA